MSRPHPVRGLRPRYGDECRNMNLGDPARFPEGIRTDNPERGKDARTARRESDRPIVGA